LTKLVLARLQLKLHTHALGQPWRCAVIVQTTGFQLPFATEHVSRRRIWVEHGWLNSANCERIATVPRNPKLPACIALAQRNAEPIVVIRHRLPDCNTRFFEPSGNMEKKHCRASGICMLLTRIGMPGFQKHCYFIGRWCFWEKHIFLNVFRDNDSINWNNFMCTVSIQKIGRIRHFVNIMEQLRFDWPFNDDFNMGQWRHPLCTQVLDKDRSLGCHGAVEVVFPFTKS
jgi:hypothetical protein